MHPTRILKDQKKSNETHTIADTYLGIQPLIVNRHVIQTLHITRSVSTEKYDRNRQCYRILYICERFQHEYRLKYEKYKPKSSVTN